MKLNNLHDLLVTEIKDLYSAEKQIVRALPKLAKAAQSEELRSAIEEHLGQTRRQVERLDQVFEVLGAKPRAETCQAMKGLIKEAEEFMERGADPMVRDAAIITCAQKVEHYEIASYGSARSHARALGNERAAQLLQETLDEEGRSDRRLTQLAEGGINAHARFEEGPEPGRRAEERAQDMDRERAEEEMFGGGDEGEAI